MNYSESIASILLCACVPLQEGLEREERRCTPAHFQRLIAENQPFEMEEPELFLLILWTLYYAGLE